MMVKSARRVMEIFELFADQKTYLTVTDVSHGLRIPQSSASMMLHSLTSLGYLTHNRDDRTFFPTLRIASVGSWMLGRTDSTRSPLEIMEIIGAACGHVVVLGIQNDTEVFYLQVVPATNALRFHMRPGSTRPICLTAVGRMLLSLKSDNEVRSIVRRVNAERDGNTPPVVAKSLLEALEHARNKGFVVNESIVTPGAAVVAMLMPGRPDQPPMAIGIGMPTADALKNTGRYVALLRESLSSVTSRDTL